MLKIQDLDLSIATGVEAIATAKRRRSPRFVIVDELGEIVMVPGETSDAEASRADFSPSVVSRLIAQLKTSTEGEVFALASPTTVLRATPLRGSIGRFYALFVEYVESRDLLANASVNFALSSREIDVLRLVLHGMSTMEIAHQLCIASTTVHAHIKNIARKTKSTKRTEILAKLLGVR